MPTQKYTFHVDGMHCHSCVLMTESELGDLPNVTRVKSSLSNHSIEIEGDFGDKTPEQIAEELTTPLRPHGYTVTVERQQHHARWGDFKIALPIALVFLALFVLLQKLGIVNLVSSNNVTYGTAFVVGLIASVSTCMAVVGGLVLSVSASFAKEGDRVRPQLYFHMGRLLSFAVLGGVIGALGSIFQIGATGTFVLSMIVAVVLLLLGVNLLEIFPSLKRFQLTMPNVIGKRVQGLKNMNHALTPFLVGGATFFLPCGFTQSMQLYTLTTGSYWTGSLLMLSFALGTLPVLALLSFSSLGIHTKTQSGIFFKSAGIVVIFFGLLNLANAFVVMGIIPPLFNI